MKLRKQMLIMLGFMAVFGTAGMWYFSNRAIEAGFEEIEVASLEGTILWGVDDILDFSLLMDSATAPIAAWDDMYEYMETRDPAFIEEVFSDTVFSRNEFNLVLVYSNTGELVYGRYFDYKAGVDKLVPEIFTEASTIDTLINFDLSTPDTLGLIACDNCSIIIGSKPILDNTETMPKRGTLVLGFDFSYEYVELIQKMTELPFQYYPVDSPRIPQEVKTELTLDSPFTYTTQKMTTQGYYLVPDIFGEPGMIITLEQPRDVYLEGQQIRREFLSVIIALGFLLGTLAIVYADRIIIHKIVRLTGEISNINEVEDLSARVNEGTGDNEINVLMRQVNKMLEQLEQSRGNEVRQHEALEKMREESTKEIFETAKKISYLIHNELDRPLRSMKQVAYSIREENKTDLAEMLENSIKYSEATLLELAALANLGEPKRTVSDLNEVVDAAIANIEPKVGVDIIAETGDEFLAINIDALKIIRAIENVIRNAVESIDKRGEVHVSVTSEEKVATVTVKDTGKGILPEDLEYIFEPFYSTKRDAMGLGLPYARQVIEAHNGTIDIETSPEGTTVTIRIPLKQSNE